MSERPVCLLLVGKTGNGKSTLGNNILGQSSFAVKAGMASKTRTSSVGTDKHKNWKVIDTQDIFNQIKSDSDRRKEVTMWKTYQPTVVLLVIKADTRYTKEEFELYSKVKELWGSDLTDRLAVVFTFGEACTKDIDYELKHASDELRTVLRDAKDRYCVFGSSGEMPGKMRDRKTLDDIVDAMNTGAAYGRGAGGAVGGSYGGTPLSTSQQKHNILVVGKAGSGKSTVGNILLGEDKFLTRSGTKIQTKESKIGDCKWFTAAEVKVIDTPDIFSIHKGSKDRQKEVKKWVEKATQDIDIILLCIRTDKEYSADEHAQFMQLREYLRDANPRSPNPCLIVIFTSDGKPNKIDLQNPRGELRAVLEAAGGRSETINVKTIKDKKDTSMMVAARLLELKWQGQHSNHTTTIIASSSSPSGASGAGATQTGKEWIILIIGKTGGGKSTVGNILLGGSNFDAKASSAKLPVGKGMSSQTMTEKTATGEQGRMRFKVIDTPDICNTDFHQKGQMKDVDRKRKVEYWKTLTQPGPDVILLVIRADGKYTEEEYAVYDTVKRMWGPGKQEEEFKSKLVVAFTFADPQEKPNFQQVLQKNASRELKTVLDHAKNRYVILDSQDPQPGVRELFGIMTHTGNPHHIPDW